MSTSKSKFYITTSIAYANAAPHIGFAMEVLQADVLARYHRLSGDDVFFLSGTDENGSKNKKTAKEKGMDIQTFVDENSAKFQLLLDVLNVSNDDFIRTTDKIRHWPSAQKLWMRLVKSGDIYKSSYEGCYCVGCEAYLTEKDLIDGKCPNHQKEPERIKEENYFFRLSKYSKIIQKKIESGEMEIVPSSRKNEILNVINDGLRDISFSRPMNTLDWGVPVPDDKTQTMYVWCDALTNYISALGYADDTDKFKKYWPADVHLIGKDILRFHAAIWPAMLISAGLPLPKKIFVHGFVTSCGQKMSKSLGNVVDPFEITQKYGVDALRYYLLKEITSGEDGDFSLIKFKELYQADLANGIGNLVARVTALAAKSPQTKARAFVHSHDFENIINDIWMNYERNINEFRLNEAILTTRKLMSYCDEYVEQKKPWQLKDNEKSEVVLNLLEAIRHIAWMIWPFLPETSMKIFEQLFADGKERKTELNKTLKEARKWGGLKPGVRIKKGEILFPRLGFRK